MSDWLTVEIHPTRFKENQVMIGNVHQRQICALN